MSLARTVVALDEEAAPLHLPRLDASTGIAGLDLLRRTAADDEDLFRLLGADDFQHHGSLYHPFPSLEAFRAFLNSLGPGAFEIVARLEGRVVGFAGLYPLHGRQTHVGSFTLCVDEAYQARGIGSVLLTAILRTAHLLIGLERVQATVFTDNRRALRLYERFGFRIEGRIARFAKRDDGYADAFVIARLFGA